MQLGGRQAQKMAAGDADDRGAIGKVVRLDENRRGTQGHDAQHRERGDGQRDLDAVGPGGCGCRCVLHDLRRGVHAPIFGERAQGS